MHQCGKRVKTSMGGEKGFWLTPILNSVTIFIYQLNSNLILSRVRVQIKWIEYYSSILSSNKIINLFNEWQLKVILSAKISSRKNIVTFFFWIKRFHGDSLLRYSKEVKWKRDLAAFLKYLNVFYIWWILHKTL